MTTFDLPDLGEGLQEAEIVAWHVGVGDHVVADQPLVSVETEKAVVEIPAPRSGRIAELLAAPGDIVKIGAPLVAFEEAGAADTGTVVGEIPVETESAAKAPVMPQSRTHGVKASPAVRAQNSLISSSADRAGPPFHREDTRDRGPRVPGGGPCEPGAGDCGRWIPRAP